MRYQRILKEISIFRLNLRKMGVLYFVPHFFLYVLIPLLGIGYILYHGNGENARGLVFFDIQKFIPFLSVWWILFGLDDYVEGSSSEILRVYKRSLLSEFWLMFGWYILHVTLLFLILGIFLESYWMDLPLIIIQCSAFASIAFFLLCVSRTLLISFLSVLLYEIFSMLSNFGMFTWINMFSLTRVSALSDLLHPYVLIFAVSIVLPFLGNMINMRKD